MDFVPRDLPGCKGSCGLMRVLYNRDTMDITKTFLATHIKHEAKEVLFCIKEVTEMTRTVVFNQDLLTSL